MKSKVIPNTLRKCELFSKLSDEELSSIVDAASVEEYEAGDIIYQQGTLGTKLYVLFKGEVSLLRKVKLDDSSDATTTVHILREGLHRSLMGSWCSLVGEEHVHMCSAKCHKRTKVVSIGCLDLWEIMAKNSNIRMKILEELVLILRDRLENSYAAMETL